MKRYITTLLMAAMLTVTIPALATTSFAQRQNCDTNNRSYRSENRRSRNNDERYQNNGEYYQQANEQQYYDQSGYYQYGQQPSVYRRHNKAFNLTIATGAGAIIGALIGGKKGALIGAGAGAAAGAIVTKKQNSNRYKYGY